MHACLVGPALNRGSDYASHGAEPLILHFAVSAHSARACTCASLSLLGCKQFGTTKLCQPLITLTQSVSSIHSGSQSLLAPPSPTPYPLARCIPVIPVCYAICESCSSL